MDLSAMYLYYNSRYLTGFDVEGSTLWATCRASKAKGICLKELWPSTPVIDIPEDIKVKADEDAYSRRISFYQRCYTLNDIKYAFTNGLPVLLSFRIFESFKNASKYGVVQMPYAGE